jgi:hypothetical protein
MAAGDNYGPTGAYAAEIQAAIAGMQNNYNYAALQQAYDQFMKQFEWGKKTDQASQAYNQQLALGWAQMSPYLNKGKLSLTPMVAAGGAAGGLGGGAGGSPYAGYLPTLEREKAQWDTGMQYANLLASLSGPTDWVKYANVQRGLAGTAYPAFMQAVANQAQLPSFQAPQGQVTSYEDLLRGAYSGQGAGQQNDAAAGWRPPPGHRLNAGTWASMSPVEQQMLQGSASASGYNWQDYLKAAQKSAPNPMGMANTLWAR